MSGFINLKINFTIWWEPRNPNVIKMCTGDPRFVDDDGGRPGLLISVKRDNRNLWNRLARALADVGQPGPPLVPCRYLPAVRRAHGQSARLWHGPQRLGYAHGTLPTSPAHRRSFLRSRYEPWYPSE